MPQVQVLKAAPSFGSQLGEALGGGFGTGVAKGISDSLAEFHQKKEQIEKFRPQARSLLHKNFKLYDPKGGYDEGFRRKAEAYADDLIQKGYSPLDASDLAYQAMVSGFPDAQGKPTFKPEAKPSKTQEILETLKGGGAKSARAILNYAQLPIELANALTKSSERGASKIRESLGLDPNKAPLDIFANLPKPINPFENQSPVEMLDVATGGRSIPQTSGQQILSGFPLGIPGLAMGAFEEAAKGLGVPEEYAPLAGLGGLLTGAKIEPRILNAVMNVAKKLPFFKKATAQSATSGVAPEAIVQEAASKLQGRGVDLTKVAEGDASAVNELNKELKKTAQTFKETETFKPKKERARREETLEKLKESPLEKYYAPEKEKGPRAQASEELRTAPLRERVKSLEGEVQKSYKALLDAENMLRKNEGKVSENAIQRLKSSVDLQRLEHSRLLNELKTTEFEIRNRKPPMTSEEIGKQIEKSFAELREGIKNPTAEKVTKVREKLAADKDAIETAQKLFARGEIPGPEVFDEYIKIHKQYNKAYQDLVDELSHFIKENQGSALTKGQAQNAKALRDLVKEMQKAGEAKIVNQVDKRKAMRALDKPSGAFFRQMLKDLKKEIADFQKQFFHVKNLTHPAEAKVAQAAKKPISNVAEIQKTAREATKNPTAENVEKLAKETGMPKQTLGEYLKSIRGDVKEAGQKASQGKISEEDVRAVAKSIVDKFNKLPRLPRSAVAGLIIGTLQATFEEISGYKPPQEMISVLAGSTVRGGAGVKLGSAGFATIVYRFLNKAFEKRQAEKLAEFRNTPEFNEKKKELENKYSKAKANRIVKEAVRK